MNCSHIWEHSFKLPQIPHFNVEAVLSGSYSNRIKSHKSRHFPNTLVETWSRESYQSLRKLSFWPQMLFDGTPLPLGWWSSISKHLTLPQTIMSIIDPMLLGEMRFLG